MPIQAEFQAVVLAAGKGSRMPELTNGKPKCLLPIGPKPLIWYPLYKLQETGFTETFLIVLESQKSEIMGVIEKLNLEIRVDCVTISGSEDLGTADSLRLIGERLKSDVLIITCDLITNENLKGVFDLFRMHNASIGTLFFHPQAKYKDLVIPGPKTKYNFEKDLVGFESQTNRLVFLASESDFEEQLTLPKALLKKHPNLKMYSNLIDSHVYLLKNWVIKYLMNQTTFSTIKGELLPFIIKKQLSKPPKLTDNKSVATKVDSDDLFNYAKEDEFDLLIREMSNFNSINDCIRCYGFIANSDKLGIRINTLPSFFWINNNIIDKWDKVAGNVELVKKHETSEVKSTQVDQNCIIWEGAKLNEKTSFKKSVIGTNCLVSSFSRVFNSVVMNNVIIKEKVALENCIVCDGAIIENNTVIKNCLVGSHHMVKGDSEYENEVLTESDRLMEF